MPETIHCPVLIIGAGPAGYTAAIYTARANRLPVVLEGLQPGGQLTITTDVENYSGFADPVEGPWLMEQMRSQATRVGARLVSDIAVEVDFTQRPFRCLTDANSTYRADAVIIATGAQAKWLGLEGETKFNGRGVSACATCDGFFYKNKAVAVVGGGNTAVEEALYLSKIAATVTVIHRGDRFRAEQVLQDRLAAKKNVRILWNREIVEIRGACQIDTTMSHVITRDVRNSALEELKLDGLFVAIGHRPNTDLFRGHLAVDSDGYIKTNAGSSHTSVPGVFAAGDVKDKVYRQAITAAGMGCMAALDAEHFLDQTGS